MVHKTYKIELIIDKDNNFECVYILFSVCVCNATDKKRVLTCQMYGKSAMQETKLHPQLDYDSMSSKNVKPKSIIIRR